ncbi:MAG: hypothetical protein JXA25_07985 [Anaerolineales bacterium]|nr:hypothetical protein [Anaerolineales bacterium]
MRFPFPALAFVLLLTLPACASPGPSEETLAQTQTAEAIALLPPTNTPPPTATPQGTATETPEPSPTPTDTPTPGPTPTATAPLLPEGDPRTGLDLSVPDFHDTFTTKYLWGEFIIEGAATNILDDERLRATDHLADTYLSWSATDIKATNFYAQISAEFTACDGKDSAGLVFRIPPDVYNRGYTLEVSCDGMYRIRKFLGEAPPLTLLDWTASDAILQGPDTVNQIGVFTDGARIIPIINEVTLEEIEDFSYSLGTFGIFSNAYETADLTIYFDDFLYWYQR